MSDHIAHLGICDDAIRLAAAHPAVEPLFQRVLLAHRDLAHMGCITRQADKWSIDILVSLRDLQKPSGTHPDPKANQKIAFVLGALTHRAADRLTKPITNCWGNDPDSAHGGDQASESKIIQDLFVFKEVYCSAHGPFADPLTPDVLTPPPSEGHAALEYLFRTLLRRSLISMHTILPDSDHIDLWLNQFIDHLQTYPKCLHEYARLAAHWDPEKIKKYLIDKHFYCRSDPLILLARDLQRGATVAPSTIAEIHKATTQTHSRYARALAKCLDYFLAASSLYQRQIDLREAQTRLDIGVPELSLQD